MVRTFTVHLLQCLTLRYTSVVEPSPLISYRLQKVSVSLSLIRSKLSHCCALWSPPFFKDILPLRGVQYCPTECIPIAPGTSSRWLRSNRSRLPSTSRFTGFLVQRPKHQLDHFVTLRLNRPPTPTTCHFYVHNAVYLRARPTECRSLGRYGV